VRLATFGGDVLVETTRAVEMAAGGSGPVWRWSAAELTPGADRYVSVTARDGSFAWNRHFFAALKDCPRTPNAPTFETQPGDRHTLRAQLTAPADGYVYFAHLASPYESTRFSDNYLDLEPAARRELTVHDPSRDLSPELLTLGWA
jgi:hypothetical protein